MCLIIIEIHCILHVFPSMPDGVFEIFPSALVLFFPGALGHWLNFIPSAAAIGFVVSQVIAIAIGWRVLVIAVAAVGIICVVVAPKAGIIGSVVVIVKVS